MHGTHKAQIHELSRQAWEMHDLCHNVTFKIATMTSFHAEKCYFL